METDQEEAPQTYEEIVAMVMFPSHDPDLPPVREEFHDLHRRTMKQIEADQAHWDQDSWAVWNGEDPLKPASEEIMFEGRLVRPVYYDTSCDTSYCYAGFALEAEGYRLFDEPGGDQYVAWMTEDGIKTEDAHKATKRVLGLTPKQTSVLYALQDGDFATFKEHMTKLTGINFD